METTAQTLFRKCYAPAGGAYGLDCSTNCHGKARTSGHRIIFIRWTPHACHTHGALLHFNTITFVSTVLTNQSRTFGRHKRATFYTQTGIPRGRKADRTKKLIMSWSSPGVRGRANHEFRKKHQTATTSQFHNLKNARINRGWMSDGTA